MNHFAQDVFVLEQWTVLFKLSLLWDGEPVCSSCLCSGTMNSFSQDVFVLEQWTVLLKLSLLWEGNRFAQAVFVLEWWTILLKMSLLWESEPFCSSRLCFGATNPFAQVSLFWSGVINHFVQAVFVLGREALSSPWLNRWSEPCLPRGSLCWQGIPSPRPAHQTRSSAEKVSPIGWTGHVTVAWQPSVWRGLRPCSIRPKQAASSWRGSFVLTPGNARTCGQECTAFWNVH